MVLCLLVVLLVLIEMFMIVGYCSGLLVLDGLLSWVCC